MVVTLAAVRLFSPLTGRNDPFSSCKKKRVRNRRSTVSGVVHVCRQPHGQALVRGDERRVPENAVGPLQVVAELGRHREGLRAHIAHERMVLPASQVRSAPGTARAREGGGERAAGGGWERIVPQPVFGVKAY